MIDGIIQSDNVKIFGNSFISGKILKEENRSYEDFSLYLMNRGNVLLSTNFDEDGTFSISNISLQKSYSLLAKDKRKQFNDIVFANVDSVPYNIQFDETLKTSEDSTRVNGSIILNSGLPPFTVNQINGSIPPDLNYSIDGNIVTIQGSGDPITSSYESWIKVEAKNGYSKIIPVYIDPYGTTGMIKNSEGGCFKVDEFRTSKNNILSLNPFSYWKFDEITGTSITDYGSSNNPLNLTGTNCVLNMRSMYDETGNGIFLAGSTGYLKPDNSAPYRNLGDLTLFASFTLNNIVTGSNYIDLFECSLTGETEATNITFKIYVTASGVTIFHEHNADVNDSGVWAYDFELGVPYKIVATRNSSSLRYGLFINDKFQGYVTYASNPTGGTSSVFSVGYCAGQSDNASSNAYLVLDEMAYWDTLLTRTEISSLVEFNERKNDWSGTVIKTRLRFDDEAVGSSSIIDDYSNTWTISNPAKAIISEDGYSGNCLFFPQPASTYYVLSATPWKSISTQDWCIQFFFQQSISGQKGVSLVDTRPPSVNGAYPYIGYDTNGYLTCYYNTGYQITGPILSDLDWHHIALSKEKGVLRMFLDGNQIGSYFTTDSCPDSSYMRLGNNNVNTASSSYFGKIDELRVDVGPAIYTKNFIPTFPYGG